MPALSKMLAALVAAVALVAGCGGADPVTTGAIPAGTLVAPEQYLADANAAAGAVRDFALVVNRLPQPLTEPAVRAAALELAEPLARAQAAHARISAERLADQRLETQRGAARTALGAVVTEMGRVTNAAQEGDLDGTKAAAADLQTAIETLRAADGSS